MSSLPDDLRALAAGQPAVADWPGLVRATVRGRRQRRSIVAGAAVLALVVGSGVGIVYASSADRDPATLTAASPTPSPTPSTGAPTQDITLAVAPDSKQFPAGVPVDLTVIATGFAEEGPLVRELRVDGTQEAPDISFSCAAQESPPPRSPTKSTRTFRRTFTPGEHVLHMRASAGCSYYRGEAELTYTITAVSEGPTPAPTASSTPEAPSSPRSQKVTVELSVRPERPQVGEEVTISIRLTWTAEEAFITNYSVEGISTAGSPACAPQDGPPPTPQAGSTVIERTHVYRQAGEDTITVIASAPCAYYSGQGRDDITITVAP